LVIAAQLRGLPWTVGKKLLNALDIPTSVPSTERLSYDVKLRELVALIWNRTHTALDDDKLGVTIPDTKVRFLNSELKAVITENLHHCETSHQFDYDKDREKYESFVFTLFFKDRAGGGRTAYVARAMFCNFKSAETMMSNIEGVIDDQDVFDKYSVVPVVLNDSHVRKVETKMPRESEFSAVKQRLNLHRKPDGQSQGSGHNKKPKYGHG